MKTGVFPVSVVWKAPNGIVQYETQLVTGFVSSRGLFGAHRSWHPGGPNTRSKFWTVSVLDCGLAIKRAMPQKVAKLYAEALDNAYGHLDTEDLQDCKKGMDELYYAVVREARWGKR